MNSYSYALVSDPCKEMECEVKFPNFDFQDFSKI